MKMEKEEKMTTADPKATKETVELWHYLHAVAGKQIITGQHTQTIPCNGPENSGKPEMVVFSPLPFTGSRLWKAETRASIPNTRILMQGKY